MQQYVQQKNETEYWPQTLIFIVPKLYNPDVAYIIIFKHECKNLTENMSFWREISSKFGNNLRKSIIICYEIINKN